LVADFLRIRVRHRSADFEPLREIDRLHFDNPLADARMLRDILSTNAYAVAADTSPRWCA
jgi:hypothetical protein